MRPLILEFAEPVIGDNIDIQQIEYDQELQLSVIKGTRISAFDYSQERSRTYTRSGGEPTDELGKSVIDLSIYSVTKSANDNEVTDSDPTVPELSALMSTKTLTFTNTEVTDEDDAPKLRQFMQTVTMTKANTEGTDSDY